MIDKLKAPISIQQELTEFCNHNCTHCYNYWRVGTSWQKDAEKIDSQKLLDIADRVVDGEVLHVVLTGGEPFVVPLSTLDALVQKYHDGNVQVSINSNITLLKQEHIDFLIKHKLGVLTSVISYDEAEFDAVTLKKGSFKKFCYNLEQLSSQGVSVGANMVVDKSRLSKVYDTGKLVASLGARGFSGTRMSPSNSGVQQNYRDLVLDNADIPVLFDQLLALEHDYGLMPQTLNALPFCAVDDGGKYASLLTRACNAGETGAGLSANGDLRLCLHFDMDVGNVLDTPLKDLWAKMPSWKLEYLDGSSCGSCVESQRCGGGCRENAYKMNGQLMGEDSLKRSPLVKRINEHYLDDIPAISYNGGVKVRDESFGAVLFRGSGSYAFVDSFALDLVKNTYSRPVLTRDDVLEIGTDIPFVDKVYVNRMFNNLVRNKIARRV